MSIPPLIRMPATASMRVQQSAPRVAAASSFVVEACERDPALLASLIESADLESPFPADAVGFLAARAPSWAAGAEPDEAGLMAALRRWRSREMVRIAWRDLAGFATIGETLLEQSAFAECAIRRPIGMHGGSSDCVMACHARHPGSRRNSLSLAWASLAAGS